MIHSKVHKDTPAAGASDASAAPPYYKSDLNIFTLTFSAHQRMLLYRSKLCKCQIIRRSYIFYSLFIIEQLYNLLLDSSISQCIAKYKIIIMLKFNYKK